MKDIRAKIACKNSDISVFEHFIDVNKLSKRANNAEVIMNYMQQKHEKVLHD